MVEHKMNGHEVTREGALGQISLYDLASGFGKTSLVPSPHPMAKTSKKCLKHSSAFMTAPFMFLDLTPEHGNLLGESYWEMNSAWLTEYWTHNGSIFHSGGAESTLSQILEDSPHPKYFLSAAACKGILRRAQMRGKELPPPLKEALMVQAQLKQAYGFDNGAREIKAYHINQRNEGIDLHGISGALMATQNMQMQTFIRHPHVYENHAQDSRYNGPLDVAPTVLASYGTGGNNTPLVQSYCISGNIVGREVQNGGNGLGCQADLAYCLTATDRHVVFGQSSYGGYNEQVGTLCASGGDHGGGSENLAVSNNTIRKLTPLECERLQGFPDGWTNLPNAADSPRYKGLGNSVAVPCVEFVLGGIARVLNQEKESEAET